MKPRDIISSAIFYLGLTGVVLLLVRLGTQYGWEKVAQDFTRMQPRIERGGHLFINKHLRQPDQLDYGDLIMYRRPPWKRLSYQYEFARVLGKPGDVVQLSDRQLFRSERREGKLDPKHKVEETYLDRTHRPADFSAFVVPRNTLFVLFDDRHHREPLRDFLVPIRAICGRVVR
jgi:signal peptidase I